tara:strand:- start:355 stop:741 length:387 start_codon:yes stop_codon:yes gene_type:complete
MSSKEIVKKSDITSFYGMDGFNLSLKASQFDVMEEMNTIIQLIRDPDPKVSLPALKHFRSVMKEVATTNGLIGNVEQSISYNDQDRNANVRQSVTSQKLLNNMKEHNERREQEPNSDKNLESLPPKQL